MELKNFFAQDLQGNVIQTPQVFLYQQGTNIAVAGLQDKAGAPLSNPFNGSVIGQITFAAPDGSYDMRVVGAGRELSIPVRFKA